MQINEIPVYVFTGFLEAGKTTFIIENLKNPGFSSGERTLVLVCEDGEGQYDNLPQEVMETTSVLYIDSQDKLNLDYLESLYNIYDFERVMIEYNGMWPINDLYQALPENWLVAQRINLIDDEEKNWLAEDMEKNIGWKRLYKGKNERGDLLLSDYRRERAAEKALEAEREKERQENALTLFT